MNRTNDFSRRNFLKGVAMTALAGAPVVNALAQTTETLSKSEVYVGKGSASEIIPKIIEKMGGMGRFVKQGARVMIKPNMSFANPPEWATTTSPEAVAVLAELCIKAGAKRVIVCDNTLRDGDICKEKSGIAAALKSLKGVVIFTPQQENMFIEKTSDKAKYLTKTAVVKEMLNCNTLISLPCAKSHAAGGVSLNIKGLMGLIYDRGTFHRDMDINMGIAEQLYYIKPDLCLVDATRALIDNGPAGPGTVSQLKTFIAGTDAVATDSFATTLAPWYGRQFEGKNVLYLKHAAALGFGNVESAGIKEIAV